MRRLATIPAALTVFLLDAAPAWAHAGHAGDHGWLWGALQPHLSIDHFLAALAVVAVGAVAFAALGRAAARGRTNPRSGS